VICAGKALNEGGNMILLHLGHILFLLTVPTNILISNVLDSLQNLIMQHADIRTHPRHYITPRVIVNMKAVIDGGSPRDSFRKCSTGTEV
jgi:Protein of unknown function (DUF3435)